MKTVAKLFFLFTLVTVVELFLLLKLAQVTSWWVSAALIVVPGLLGAWLAKREGSRTLREIRNSVVSGKEPTGPILDGVLVLLAGVLLLTPGVLTDLTGLIVLVPKIRRRVRDQVRLRVKRAIDRRIAGGQIQFVGFDPFGGSRHPVIDAEDIEKPL